MSQVTYYPFHPSRGVFRGGSINTNRYDRTRNYLLLHPRDSDVENTSYFIRTVFRNMNVYMNTYRDRFDCRKRCAPNFVRYVRVEGPEVRDTVQRLFRFRHLNDDERCAAEPALKELDASLEFQAQLGEGVESAQKDVIEFIIDPYIDDLKTHLKPPKLKFLLEEACITLRDFTDSKTVFMEKMKFYLEARLPEETKNDILDALYMIGSVLAGKANMESTLLRQGTKLPNLEMQKQIVMKKLGLVNDPPPNKKARTS